MISKCTPYVPNLKNNQRIKLEKTTITSKQVLSVLEKCIIIIP